MKFVDSCEVKVVAGSGGNGCVAFRREKFVPFGGPSGGDGGKGGDVVFQTDPGMSTLMDLAYAHTLQAKGGENGRGKDQYGRAGEDRVVRMPVGTQVFDNESGELLFDLDTPNVSTVIAKGGQGGRGNIHFASAYDRAPRRAEQGEPGQERKLRLELKVMADVGLLGFPNVGKSTFIRAVSRARPKVADYPFTTLTPHLGVVSIGEEAHFVLADIPGLIPGASHGAGLGIRFLKHVERTRALLHLVTLDHTEGREPLADFEALMHELRTFDPELAKRPQIVAMSKADLPEVREAYESLKPKLAKMGIDLKLVSAATGEGVRQLAQQLYTLVNRRPEDVEEEEATRRTAQAHPRKAQAQAQAQPRKAPKKKKPPAKKTATKTAKKTAHKPAAKKTAITKKTAKKSAKKPAAKKRDERQNRRAHAKKTSPRTRRGR